MRMRRGFDPDSAPRLVTVWWATKKGPRNLNALDVCRTTDTDQLDLDPVVFPAA